MSHAKCTSEVPRQAPSSKLGTLRRSKAEFRARCLEEVQGRAPSSAPRGGLRLSSQAWLASMASWTVVARIVESLNPVKEGIIIQSSRNNLTQHINTN
nr:hypothetical protein Iba_scaffold1011.2CG0160 [Ipomoea batatas]